METTASPHWKFWGTLLWGVVIAGIFILTQIAVAFFIFAKLGETERADFALSIGENGTYLALATCATTLICSLLIIGIIKLKRGASIKNYLALHTVPRQRVLMWFIGAALLIVLSDMLLFLAGRPIVTKFLINSYTSANSVWLLSFALIIAAPLFEELFFRGFLMRGLQHSPLKPTGAVIVTSTLWAFIHQQYDWYGIAFILIFGLMLGIARIKTTSLLLPMGMHAYVNAASMLQVIYILRQ